MSRKVSEWPLTHTACQQATSTKWRLSLGTGVVNGVSSTCANLNMWGEKMLVWLLLTFFVFVHRCVSLHVPVVSAHHMLWQLLSADIICFWSDQWLGPFVRDLFDCVLFLFVCVFACACLVCPPHAVAVVVQCHHLPLFRSVTRSLCHCQGSLWPHSSLLSLFCWWTGCWHFSVAI